MKSQASSFREAQSIFLLFRRENGGQRCSLSFDKSQYGSQGDEETLNTVLQICFIHLHSSGSIGSSSCSSNPFSYSLTFFHIKCISGKYLLSFIICPLYVKDSNNTDASSEVKSCLSLLISSIDLQSLSISFIDSFYWFILFFSTQCLGAFSLEH